MWRLQPHLSVLVKRNHSWLWVETLVVYWTPDGIYGCSFPPNSRQFCTGHVTGPISSPSHWCQNKKHKPHLRETNPCIYCCIYFLFDFFLNIQKTSHKLINSLSTASSHKISACQKGGRNQWPPDIGCCHRAGCQTSPHKRSLGPVSTVANGRWTWDMPRNCENSLKPTNAVQPLNVILRNCPWFSVIFMLSDHSSILDGALSSDFLC